MKEISLRARTLLLHVLTPFRAQPGRPKLTSFRAASPSCSEPDLLTAALPAHAPLIWPCPRVQPIRWPIMHLCFSCHASPPVSTGVHILSVSCALSFRASLNRPTCTYHTYPALQSCSHDGQFVQHVLVLVCTLLVLCTVSMLRAHLSNP